MKNSEKVHKSDDQISSSIYQGLSKKEASDISISSLGSDKAKSQAGPRLLKYKNGSARLQLLRDRKGGVLRSRVAQRKKGGKFENSESETYFPSSSEQIDTRVEFSKLDQKVLPKTLTELYFGG